MLPLLPFLFLFFFFFHPLPPANSLNSEGSALLSLKQSLTDPEGFLSNWNYSDSNPCSWNGVTCNFLKVISISIPKSKLHGSLPSSLGSLSQLRHVNFRSNNLFGSIPTELFQALKLQSLVLYDNSFSGYVPNEIGNLRYIQTLDLSQNFFNGSFPNAIFSCKRLQFLDLSENNFTGSLPNNGFGTNFLSLQLLDLSFNNFIGSIPSDLGNLSSLQGTVDLSHNNFSGSIPPSLGNLPEKVYIDLTFNNLSGPIPQNGALVNRGPTAFLGNPSLCGPPLKNPCSSEETHANNSSTSSSSSSSLPSIPDNDNIPHSENHKGKGLGKISVIAIVVGDLVGIFLLGLLFSFCYSRICGSSDQVKDENVGIEKEEKGKKNCLFFRKDESETLSDNLEHINHNDNDNNNKLVALDSQVGFDLDELLKASAFVLGKSGIGIVYKVVFEDGLTLAVRRLEEGGSQRLKEFQNEVETIGKMRHPNVVTLRAYYWSIDEKLLIYDFVPNGSLASAIHGKAGLVTFTPLSWSMRLKIMKGIAKGLVYLHEFSPKKFVHGDLKPSNILLGQNMEPCISDFGLGRLANIAGLGRPMTMQSNRVAAEKPHEKHKRASSSSEVGASTTTISSTLGNGYRAPESLEVMKPSQKWDVYSYGVILLEMITGRLPLVQVNNFEMDLVQWIQFSIEEKKPFKDVLDPYLAQDADREDEIVSVLKMAMACVHGSPEKRPAMRHVLEGLHRLSVSYD